MGVLSICGDGPLELGEKVSATFGRVSKPSAQRDFKGASSGGAISRAVVGRSFRVAGLANGSGDCAPRHLSLSEGAGHSGAAGSGPAAAAAVAAASCASASPWKPRLGSGPPQVPGLGVARSTCIDAAAANAAFAAATIPPAPRCRSSSAPSTASISALRSPRCGRSATACHLCTVLRAWSNFASMPAISLSKEVTSRLPPRQAPYSARRARIQRTSAPHGACALATASTSSNLETGPPWPLAPSLLFGASATKAWTVESSCMPRTSEKRYLATRGAPSSLLKSNLSTRPTNSSSASIRKQRAQDCFASQKLAAHGPPCVSTRSQTRSIQTASSACRTDGGGRFRCFTSASSLADTRLSSPAAASRASRASRTSRSSRVSPRWPASRLISMLSLAVASPAAALPAVVRNFWPT
mmetsp:Transcript_7219/g.11757  ORF Transcript_7219/g.11757 Transcript_7219/m.11757 type:complete len:413 (+) Transcript_7219:844-2082(+)